jgi:hypothetical protein
VNHTEFGADVKLTAPPERLHKMSTHASWANPRKFTLCHSWWWSHDY